MGGTGGKVGGGAQEGKDASEGARKRGRMVSSTRVRRVKFGRTADINTLVFENVEVDDDIEGNGGGGAPVHSTSTAAADGRRYVHSIYHGGGSTSTSASPRGGSPRDARRSTVAAASKHGDHEGEGVGEGEGRGCWSAVWSSDHAGPAGKQSWSQGDRFQCCCWFSTMTARRTVGMRMRARCTVLVPGMARSRLGRDV